MSNNDDNPTEPSGDKKKKGLKKLRSSFSGAIKKRRRRRKKSGSGSGSQVSGDSESYDSYSASAQSADDAVLLRNSGNPSTTAAQQEWIHGGASGLAEMAAISESRNNSRTNSAGGRGHSLTKIAELPEEEDGDYDSPAARRRRSHNNHSKRRHQKSDSSVSSRDSKRSIGSFFGRKESPKADPLSLVVLLVEPSSLRFELLSLDFDLTPKKSRKSRRKSDEKANQSKLPELQLTVQDVLDQITPESLTDETLQKTAATPGACRGLIDRTGTVHFGGSSLEAACASRPLRAFDTALSQQKQAIANSKVLLSVPTYSGEPHKDVLLGFFGNPPNENDDDAAGILSEETQEGVANALELARPIFGDPNVVGLMESSGYDLKGWKSERKPASSKLGKPLPPPVREPKTTKSPFSKLLLGLLAILMATILAWSVVAGGLHYLPSIADGADAKLNGPSTLEGHVLWAYQSAKAWYANRTAIAA